MGRLYQVGVSAETLALLMALGACDVGRSYQQPPMENPARGLSRVATTALGGNSKTIKPGESAILIQESRADSAAELDSVSVYPMTTDKTLLFSPISSITGPPDDFGGFSYVEVDFGVGGSVSERVFVDLRRGITLSVLWSSITVRVFNNSTKDLIVGAALGMFGNLRPAHDLTVTIPAFNNAKNANIFFTVPPYSRDFVVYTKTHQSPPNSAAASAPTIRIAQFMFATPGAAILEVQDTAASATDSVITGPLDIISATNGLELVDVAGAAAAWDALVQFNLAL